MLLETKYEFGQKVFVSRGSNIEECIIKGIVTNTFTNRDTIFTQVYYKVGRIGIIGILGEYIEASVFTTKEQAVIYWLEQQNLDMPIIKAKI